MKHPILDKHGIIFWDQDKTLIDGPHSDFFRDYIAHHTEKKHFIITFRDKDWANDIWEELQEAGLDARRHIQSVENCPEDIYKSFAVEICGKFDHLTEEEKAWVAKVDVATYRRHLSEFLCWKAMRAKELGGTLLVDDLEDWVIHGCKLHGVEFYHSHTKF